MGNEPSTGNDKDSLLERKDELSTLNVLVMGRSGAGKSTFINICFNLARNLEFTDKRLFGIPAKFLDGNGELINFDCNIPEYEQNIVEVVKEVGSSYTQFVSSYKIKINGSTINLIDTPGFGDTRGPAQDKKKCQADHRRGQQKNSDSRHSLGT